MRKILCLLFLLPVSLFAQRSEVLLDSGWEFHQGDGAARWRKVTVPHDWAIYGPFDRENDLQNVAVTQNMENRASLKTGRTGGLPGWASAGIGANWTFLPENGRRWSSTGP